MESLFEKLGGQPAIDKAVDLFYDRIPHDKQAGHFFANINLDQRRKMQKAFVTMAFGGFDHYVGRSMKRAHKYLHLEEADFMAVVNLMKRCMKDVGATDELLKEVDVILMSLYDDIMKKQE